ncbi:hypothetical protein HDA32_000028 [Spinactinospora alkalitolerans]|uniref:Pilus assembly protein TadE n=1 Tax=Spinactinospora alkalitolerans TaxID=687207 RepID=A0A852TLU5_9ACTN|nr:TadE family type IV pilus minor pilin [Spinactinospora alkalitolerans]NYE44908.1 hypothetical protein [Spinactinospora alkalitolerans]
MRRRCSTGCPAPRRGGVGDRGTVTAEIAVALPGLALILGIALAAVQAAATHLACVDAARIGARALARGEDHRVVRDLVSRLGPVNADVRLSEDVGLARVRVSAPVPLGPGPSTPLRVGGEAATPIEPER